MSRRLDIELTSTRPDGVWTWRASGAREPRGELQASLVPAGTQVGAVLRVEIETDFEGSVVTAVLPPKAERNEPARLEFLGPQRPDGPLVTETRVPKSERRGRRGDDDRPPRRRDGGPGRGGEGQRRDRSGPRQDRDGRSPRGGRPEGGRGAPGEGRRTPGRGTERRDRQGGRSGRPRPESDERAKPPRAPRLRARRTHRNALLAAVPEAHRPLTEEVLRGGLPAVRETLERLNAALRADDKAEIAPAAVLDLAERLVPVARLAEWQDRADAALEQVEAADLRDLRSVLVAADTIARDDDSRAKADELRVAVNARVDREHRAWLDSIGEALREGRVIRALKTSSRPPKAGAPFPPELAEQLRAAATTGLAEAAGPDRTVVILDALAVSPVRLQVQPAFTSPPAPAVLDAIRRLRKQLPQFAAALPAPAPKAAAPAPPAPGAGEATPPVEAAPPAEPVPSPTTPA